MKISLSLFSGRRWTDTLELCKFLDQNSWHAVYISDHFMRELTHCSDSEIFECWTTLAALAASTSNINIGSLVTSVSMRHPAVIAKMAATVNSISNDRLILGVGSGWDEYEHGAYGIPILDIKDRFNMFEESLIIIRGLLENNEFSYAGNYFSVERANCSPRPQNYKIPIMVGSWKGSEKVINLSKQYADHLNIVYPAHLTKNINLELINIHKSVYIPIIYIDEYSKKILQKYKNNIPKNVYAIHLNANTLKSHLYMFNEIIIGDFSFITEKEDLFLYLDHLMKTFNFIFNSSSSI